MPTIDPDLLDALEQLPRTQVTGSVWRHMFGSNPPELTNTRGARWNPRGVEAIYVSLNKAVAIAEGQHAIDVQPLRPRVRRTVYELRVDLPDLLDLTADAAIEAVGLTPDDIASDDFSACQAVGRAVAWLGVSGFIVPSARAAGGNVVILVSGLDPDALFETVAAEQID